MHWGAATKAPEGWTYPAPTTENRVLYEDAIRSLAERYNFILFKVPTSGDGTIAANPRRVAGKDLPNYNLSDYVDVLDDHHKNLKPGEHEKYANWFFGDETARFETLPDGDKRVAKAIDPDAPGNLGLVNKEKIRLRRDSVLLFQYSSILWII